MSMNRKGKRDFYHSVDINAIDNDKKFWKAVKPMFPSGNPMGEKAVLIEEGEVMSDDKVIAECLNSHFVNITDSLGLDPSFKDDRIDVSLENKVEIATEKCKNHPSIVAMKSKVQIEQKFEFSNAVAKLAVMLIMLSMSNNFQRFGYFVNQKKYVLQKFHRNRNIDITAHHITSLPCRLIPWSPVLTLAGLGMQDLS